MRASVCVCECVCVFAFFKYLPKRPLPTKIYKKESQETSLLALPFLLLLLFVVSLCLGDFHSITSFFSFCALSLTRLFSVIFFSFFFTLLFSGIYCLPLPTYLPTIFSLQATYATACTHILEAVRVVRVFFFHLISLQGELPAN